MNKVKMLLIGFMAIGVVLAGCESISDAEEPPSVLVVTLNSVHRVWPPTPPELTDRNYTLDYTGGDVKTMDFNYENKSFCYIQPRILFRLSNFTCVSVDNFTQSWQLSTQTLFPSQFWVTVIAYDWASGAWYFTDALHRCLYVCDGTLQHCRILHRDVEDPRGLAVDPTPPKHEGQAAGFQFWSQTNQNPSRLARSSLSGDDVIALLPEDCTGACNPKALTLDIANKLIFWVDGTADTVEQSNYDGSNRITVFKISKAYNRDIRVFSTLMSTLYLPGYRGIGTAPFNSTETFTSVYGYPSTAIVYHGSRQPKVSHPCAENNGGCDHVCVTTYRGVTPFATCLCQHGYQAKHGVCTRIQLDTFMLVSRGQPPEVEVRAPPLSDTLGAAPAGGSQPAAADLDTHTEYIYFSDVFVKQIFRQKLDGTGREEFIKDGIGECQGLAVDWMGGNLYWTDAHTGRVSVAPLSAPALRREVIKANLLHPYSIALDPERGVMYYSLWARGPTGGSIETANMDGSERRMLVSEKVEWPNGLVLDRDRQILYWCDTKLNKIESLELASKKRSTILAAPQTSIQDPYGLLLLEGDLIWSEQKTGLIRRLGAGGNVTDISKLTPPLYDIRVVSKGDRHGRNACSSDNGGCAELCLATPAGRTCECAAGRTPDAAEPTRCVEAN